MPGQRAQRPPGCSERISPRGLYALENGLGSWSDNAAKCFDRIIFSRRKLTQQWHRLWPLLIFLFLKGALANLAKMAKIITLNRSYLLHVSIIVRMISPCPPQASRSRRCIPQVLYSNQLPGIAQEFLSSCLFQQFLLDPIKKQNWGF